MCNKKKKILGGSLYYIVVLYMKVVDCHWSISNCLFKNSSNEHLFTKKKKNLIVAFIDFSTKISKFNRGQCVG